VSFAKEDKHRAAADITADSLCHDPSQPIKAPPQIDGLEADEDLDTVGNHWTPSLVFRVSTSSSTIASVPRSNPLGTTSRIPPISTAIAPVDSADQLAESCLGDRSTRARAMLFEGTKAACARPDDGAPRKAPSLRNFAAQFHTWRAEQPWLSANSAALSLPARHSEILSRHSLAFAMLAKLHHPTTARKTGSMQRIPMIKTVRPVLGLWTSSSWLTGMQLRYIEHVFGPGNSYGNPGRKVNEILYGVAGTTYAYLDDETGNTALTVDQYFSQLAKNLQAQTKPWLRQLSCLARKYGVAAMCYEGSQHTLVANSNQAGTAVQVAAQYDARMKTFTTDMYTAWFEVGGGLHSYSGIAYAYSAVGQWGLGEWADREDEPAEYA
jgi:hypothetical protein